MVSTLTTRAHGSAERDAALLMAETLPGVHRVTLGEDKGYDAHDFIAELPWNRAFFRSLLGGWGLPLRERRQLYEVTRGYRLERLACLLPGSHPAHDNERVESLFPELQRHPGAGRFACSSTVDINVFILG